MAIQAKPLTNTEVKAAKVASDWYEVKKSQPLAANTIKDIWRSLEKYVFPFIGNQPISQLLTARHFITALEPIRWCFTPSIRL